MKHFLLYTGMRILLLVATAGLAYALGMRGFLLILVAFLVSGVISFFVLRMPREQLGNSIGGYFKRINAKIDAATAAEDAATAPSASPTDRTVDVRPAPESTPERPV